MEPGHEDVNSNLGRISHRFGDIAGFFVSQSDPNPIQPQFRGCSRRTRWPRLGVPRSKALSCSAVKLFSKYSNRCQKRTSTLDGRTDGRTICDLITALCVASRGKNRSGGNTFQVSDSPSPFPPFPLCFLLVASVPLIFFSSRTLPLNPAGGLMSAVSLIYSADRSGQSQGAKYFLVHADKGPIPLLF